MEYSPSDKYTKLIMERIDLHFAASALLACTAFASAASLWYDYVGQQARIVAASEEYKDNPAHSSAIVAFAEKNEDQKDRSEALLIVTLLGAAASKGLDYGNSAKKRELEG
jgi:hypothetical protein